MTPCQTQPVPAGSKMVLLLPKVEPISDSDGTFVITYLRTGKKKNLQQLGERSEKM